MYAMNLQPGQTIRHSDGQIYRAIDKGRTFVNIANGSEMLLGPLVEVEPVEVEPEAPKPPSIVAINIRTLYGRMGQGGVATLQELTQTATVYAHNMDEALQWIKSQPLFANVEVRPMGDARRMVMTDWVEVEPTPMDTFIPREHTHTCTHIIAHPVNTIGVSAGYR